MRRIVLAGGIAQALGLARGFGSSDSSCVILGDSVFADDLTPAQVLIPRERPTEHVLPGSCCQRQVLMR